MTLELTYETHSTTEDNEAGIATGWLPGRLSARGRAQAVELGRRRRGGGYAVVVSSDLARAVKTARIAFDDSGIPIVLDRRLRECDYGELTGHPVAELAAVRLDHVEVPFPVGGQSYREVVDATQDLLVTLRQAHEGERVLLVGHSANRWALQHLLDGIPLETTVSAPFDWQPGWSWTLP